MEPGQACFINLEARTDRRAHMRAELARVGLEAERLVAVTPADLPPELLAAHCDQTRDTWITPAELAAAHSHRRAWTALLDGDAPWALVLEDDVRLAAGLVDALARLAPQMSELDLLRIETRRRDYRLGRATRRLAGGLALHPPASFEWGSAGYLISRAGARRLLDAPAPFALPVDNLLFDPRSPLFAGLRILQSAPALVTTRDGDADGCWHSDIQAGRSARVKQQWSQRKQRRQHERAAGPGRLARLWRSLVAGERSTVVPFADELSA